MEEPSVKKLSKSSNLEDEKEHQNTNSKKETRSNSGKTPHFRWDGAAKKQHDIAKETDEIKEKLREPGPPPGFCTQVAFSEEVSMVEQFGSRTNKDPSSQASGQSNVQPANVIQNNSDFHLLEEKKKKDLSRPTFFNILVAGASGLGKSSFIDAFLLRKFIQLPVIRYPTSKIEEHIGTRKEGLVELTMCMIDTPGYRVDTFRKYSEDLISEITERFRTHYQSMQRAKQRKSVVQNFQQPKDIRIHCCIYFMNGPRISKEDGYIINKLSKYVNIIPVLARGDTYTKDEIREIKKNILIQKQEERLQWFQCEEVLRSRHPQKLQELTDGPFGKAPPFVMVSSIKRIKIMNQRTILGRQYEWGICDMENKNHSDYMLLYNLLIAHYSEPLIKLTQIQQEEYMSETKARNPPQKENYIKYAFVGAALGFVGFLAYTKRQ